MNGSTPEGCAERVLIVAPVGRDAVLIEQTLARVGLAGERCATIDELCRQIDEGAGAVLVTSEALGRGSLLRLLETLSRQPLWSDLPLVILTSVTTGGRRRHGGIAELEGKANVTLLERPVQAHLLLNATRAALRARRRQYDARTLLAREQAARVEVEAASRAKDEFLATVSHELRTPLTAMLGWARMLRTGAVPAERRQRALEVIERNAQAQTQLIEDLLDVSRIISGNLRLQVDPVNVKHVVELALDIVRPAAEAKGIRLQPVLDPNAGPIMGDAGRLQQIAWNLLINAVKFTPRGGRVQIELRRMASSVELVVADSGQGISQDFLPHVFERFRQADGTTTRAHGGLGLGLAIVRHLVELHGGTIEAHSDGLGRGAAFVVKIPIAPLRSAPLEPAKDQPASATPIEPLHCPPELVGLRILVVDDEADTRDLIALVLEHCQARVIQVGSAEEALEAIQREVPDILVSDIGMPHGDGYFLIQKIRALPVDQGGRTPAVALTAFARIEDRTRALRAGFDVHAVKPIEPAELLTVLARLVGRTSSDRVSSV